jgi:hypothetical protein
MGCRGLHCDGCRQGGGPAGGMGAVLVLLVIIALAARSVWPQIVSAVEIAGWTVAGVSATAIAVTGGVLTRRAVRAHRARRAAVLAGRPVITITPPRGHLGPARPGIEPPPAARPRPLRGSSTRPASGASRETRP